MRLVYMEKGQEGTFADFLAGAVKDLPEGIKMAKFRGRPLAWEASFDVESRTFDNGVSLGKFIMVIYIDAKTGDILSADSTMVSPK